MYLCVCIHIHTYVLYTYTLYTYKHTHLCSSHMYLYLCILHIINMNFTGKMVCPLVGTCFDATMCFQPPPFSVFLWLRMEAHVTIWNMSQQEDKPCWPVKCILIILNTSINRNDKVNIYINIYIHNIYINIILIS